MYQYFANLLCMYNDKIVDFKKLFYKPEVKI